MKTKLTTLFLAITGTLGLAGCPGSIPVDERARFVGGTSCGIALESVPGAILAPRCATAGCHDTASRAGGLDLASAGVASRLLGVESSTCNGHTLLVAGDVSHSFFYEKLNPNPACGTQMPNGMPPLAASDLACIQAWLRSVDGSTDGGVDVVPPMDVPVDNPPVDVPIDNPPVDVRDVTPMDMGTDTGPDDAVDVPMDVPIDVADDTHTDTGSDMGTDTGVDTGSTDAAMDVADGE